MTDNFKHVAVSDSRYSDMPFFIPWQLDDMPLSDAEFRIYFHLVRLCHKSKRLDMTITRLSESMSKKRNTICATLRRLCELGMLKRYSSEGHSQRVVYILLPMAEWRPEGDETGTPMGNGQTENQYPYGYRTSTPMGTGPVPDRVPVLVSNKGIKNKGIRIKEDTVNPISAPVPPAPPPPQPGPRRPSGRAPSTASPIAMDIAGKWHAWAMQCRPYLVSTSVKSFAKAIDEIMVRHSINPDGMLKIMEYVQRDEFWSKNAVSPCGLTKKSANGLYKIENILAQMQKDRGWKHKMMLESGQFDEVQF